MKVLRLIGAAAALVVSTSVFATATPITTSYTFNNPSATTNYNPYGSTYGTNGTANANSYAGYQGSGDTTVRATGSYFGNVLTFGASSGATSANSTVQVSAYAGTGLGSDGYIGGSKGTIENAVLTQYNNSLAITSRNSSQVGNNEFSCSGTTSCTPSSGSPDYQHAIDNTGAFETLLLKFNTAVNLTSLTLGFPGAGAGNANVSDATLLYYKGTGDPTSAMLGKTYAQLVASGTWGYTNVMGIANSTCGTVADCATVAATTASQYWMIGAFINTIDNNAALSNGNDYIKIQSITTSRVPEPGTIALLGIAGVAMVGRRRRQPC